MMLPSRLSRHFIIILVCVRGVTSSGVQECPGAITIPASHNKRLGYYPPVFISTIVPIFKAEPCPAFIRRPCFRYQHGQQPARRMPLASRPTCIIVSCNEVICVLTQTSSRYINSRPCRQISETCLQRVTRLASACPEKRILLVCSAAGLCTLCKVLPHRISRTRTRIRGQCPTHAQPKGPDAGSKMSAAMERGAVPTIWAPP